MRITQTIPTEITQVDNVKSNPKHTVVDAPGTHLAVNEIAAEENGQSSEQAYRTAVNKLNEFMEYSQKKSKFVLHKDLERYYVEVVDAQTQEVVKEIPPKELLDAYYEMQKLVGKMFDTQA